MLRVAWIIPFLLLSGCGPSQWETQRQQRQQEYQTNSAEAKSIDDANRAKYTEIAKQLEAASDKTAVTVNSLTTKESIDNYSDRIAALLSLISSAENDPKLQSPRAWLRPYVDPSLQRARQAAASAYITKGKAQLQMSDFDGARATFRNVVVAFNPTVYGVYTRQAEFLLQDVEKAEAASKNSSGK